MTMQVALSAVFDAQNGYIRRHHTYEVSDGGSIEELRALTQFARDVLRACEQDQEVYITRVDHHEAPQPKRHWGKVWPLKDHV